MELSLVIAKQRSGKEIAGLKQFIERNGIDGLSSTLVETGEYEPGMQGMEILNSIKLIIEAAEKPLVELVNCIQKYVDSYRSGVIIKSPNGASLEIKMGRGIDKDTLKIIVKAFLKDN